MFKKLGLDEFLDTFPYKIELVRAGSAKRLSIRVYIGNQVVIRAPKRTSDRVINKFLKQRSAWIIETIQAKQIIGQNILGDDYYQLQQSDPEHFKLYKSAAADLIDAKIGQINIHKWQIERLSVKRMKTRWGSCSNRGNLNFNYKILFLTPKLQDYLIWHELCHLKHHNHSREYWKLVESGCADYKQLDKQLRGL